MLDTPIHPSAGVRTSRTPAAQSTPARRPPVLTRRVAIGVGALLLAVVAVLTVASVTTEWWYWSRILAWRSAAFEDYATKFSAREVPNAPPVLPLTPAPLELPAAFATVRGFAPSGDAAEPLDGFLSRTNTRALLVLKDDQLMVERYANGSSHEATQTSFSMAKSIASTLVGIAVGERLIGSVDDPVVRYLPELSGRGLETLTIRHLLGMSSGLAYSGSGSDGLPWQDDAKTYYDPDLRALALTVRPAVAPGSRWEYNNYHPLLIGLILERATGRSVSQYLSEKIWQPAGMEAPASWSLDSRHDGFEKMESGVNARAADFARLGRLFLKRGVANGRQVVPAEWVALVTRANDPALAPNYGLFWWLDTQRPGRFYAAGNLGQYIYVAPDHDAVITRAGSDFGGLDHRAWLAVLRSLADAVP